MYTILLILMVPITIAFFLIFFKRKEWISKIPKMPKLSSLATPQDKSQNWRDGLLGTLFCLLLIFGSTSLTFPLFVGYLLSLIISAVIAIICLGVGMLSKDNKKLQRYTMFHLIAILVILIIAGVTGKVDVVTSWNPDPEARSVINQPTATTEAHKPQWITLPDGSITANLEPGQMITKTFYLPSRESSPQIIVPGGGYYNLSFRHDNNDILYQRQDEAPVLERKDESIRFSVIKGTYKARFIATDKACEIVVTLTRS